MQALDIIAVNRPAIRKHKQPLPVTNSTPTQLRFVPSAGFTLRADFNGGGLPSDSGPLLLRGDGHFFNPELMRLIDVMPNTDFLCGLAGNAVLNV